MKPTRNVILLVSISMAISGTQIGGTYHIFLAYSLGLCKDPGIPIEHWSQMKTNFGSTHVNESKRTKFFSRNGKLIEMETRPKTGLSTEKKGAQARQSLGFQAQ